MYQAFLEFRDAYFGRLPALAVRRHAKPTLEETLAIDPESPGSVVEYYVTDAPPYYLAIVPAGSATTGR